MEEYENSLSCGAIDYGRARLSLARQTGRGVRRKFEVKAVRHANALKHENFRLVDARDEQTDETVEQSLQEPPSEAASETGEPALKTRIDNLKAAALTLLQEVHALTEVETANIEEGIDFYEEVRRFEMQLIARALEQTGGHQGRAARLLKLKLSTLNSILKRYQISPHDAARRIALPDTAN
ncbi:MAG TPA: helix-turn-helix domain-containing protein [Pyrinomonadaceae bacterium]|nr:helix-turn-helix domain-containing protein [Pyrinomonadaceae bacterium]